MSLRYTLLAITLTIPLADTVSAAPSYQTVEVSPQPTSYALPAPNLDGGGEQATEAFFAAGFDLRIFTRGLNELLPWGGGSPESLTAAVNYDEAARDWLAASCFEDPWSQSDLLMETTTDLKTLRSNGPEMRRLTDRMRRCLSAENRLRDSYTGRSASTQQWEVDSGATPAHRWAIGRAQAMGFDWVTPHRLAGIDEARMRENLDSIKQALGPLVVVTSIEELWRGQEKLDEEDRAMVMAELAKLHTDGPDGDAVAIWSIEVGGEGLEFRYDSFFGAWRSWLFTARDPKYKASIEAMEEIRGEWACRLGDFVEIRHKEGRKEWNNILMWPRDGCVLSLDLIYDSNELVFPVSATLTITPVASEVGPDLLVHRLTRHRDFSYVSAPSMGTGQLSCEAE